MKDSNRDDYSIIDLTPCAFQELGFGPVDDLLTIEESERFFTLSFMGKYPPFIKRRKSHNPKYN